MRWLTLLLLAGALAAAPRAARADAAGDQMLAELDAALNRARSHHFQYQAVTREPGRGERKLGLEVWWRGDRRLTAFTAPADLKGTKVLVISPTEMYAYLPAFGKVRRIASHTTDQSAFGMAFSQDDLAMQRYAGEYTATIARRDDQAVELTLVPRAGRRPPYGKLEMTLVTVGGVGGIVRLPAQIRYYGQTGAPIKTETRTGYGCEREVCVPGELTMVDHAKGDLTTVITRTGWKLDEPFADDLLSKRTLDK